jgi:hypothetical protein
LLAVESQSRKICNGSLMSMLRLQLSLSLNLNVC